MEPDMPPTEVTASGPATSSPVSKDTTDRIAASVPSMGR